MREFKKISNLCLGLGLVPSIPQRNKTLVIVVKNYTQTDTKDYAQKQYTVRFCLIFICFAL